ncbi:MAG: bifunctional phosphopantothenoylcysteine decarboxylase/phosphopantothenate--cysteine ligase CoaBC [Micavibrio aeruginosavorus]|uniref:Coenzyme A biosynthesis bifunctional protein CoaBC n=1 Tax=Micavibrio aeruginosavorus TaxID=349221 RepID=A0A2W5PSV8_9BACT|nr:MAG: bifunctional phosphopantothenoylcysteine decarboxylase/phosphopantothenate--cysteine ligase CoaBC [Micavibrio aeruginosavorus]
MLNGKKILLVISGGIAAYKSLELIRLFKKNGASVRCILTSGGSQFVTPLSVAALSEEQVYTDLFSLKDETEMGHIRLSRECDLIVVAPASANMIAKIAHGMADDLASTTILASDKPIMVCPAMNPMMWENAATQDNIKTLQQRGIILSGPAAGEMACGEIGYGRLLEPDVIFDHVADYFSKGKKLAGLTALVTAGPTFEPIDPVRFVGNRSSGKQGYAIAAALVDLGINVTLVSGPTNEDAPSGVKLVRVETAAQMLETCEKHLPSDIAVFAAAVADWTPSNPSVSKMKKTSDTAMTMGFTQTVDILAAVSKDKKRRPRLVVGFAAETDDVIANAKAKLSKKGCDWLVANSVSSENPVFGSDQNQVYFVTSGKVEEWPRMGKDDVAREIASRIAAFFDRKALAAE